MDTFALSIFLGTIVNKKQGLMLIIFVGLFHFFMPIMGSILGYKIGNIISINGDLIYGIILLLLSLQIFISLYKEEEIPNLQTFEIILLAYGVAIDSFSIGFGLSFSNNDSILLSSVIFLISSMIFTYLGLIIGKYSSNLVGIYSKTFGGILLLILALKHII